MGYISMFHPDFCWHPVPTTATQQAKLDRTPHAPPVRRIIDYPIRILIGYIHQLLFKLSWHYCRWWGITYHIGAAELPFGLQLKTSDNCSVEEVAAMRLARQAGLPVPLVISYGEHSRVLAPISILMTRMQGREMHMSIWEEFSPEAKEVFISQLRSFLKTIRAWYFPYSEINCRRSSPPVTICSPLGTTLRDQLVPLQCVGPCRDEDDFDEYLLRPAKEMTWAPDYSDLMADVATFQARPRHPSKFTHGFLAPHKLFVMPDGRISAIINWEQGGWYPSYWEFTRALGRRKPDNWWYNIIMQVGGEEFLPERRGDRARQVLAGDWLHRRV